MTYWSNRLWLIELSVDGHFRRRLALSPKRNTKSGWAYKADGRWFAVYRDGTQLRFRSDDWSCIVGPEYQCSLECKASDRRIFSLQVGKTPVFQFEYRPPSLGKAVDITYDALDMENDDFFLWLCNLWNDPAMRDGLLLRLVE